MTYRAPINDILLALNHGAGLQAAVKAGHYGDFDGDITAAVLEEAGKFAGDVLAPLNRVGDEHGIKLEDDKVTTAPGWPDAYQRWTAAGWNAVSGPEAFGGQGLPLAINAACTEIWSASNIAFGLCPLLTLSRDRGARRPWQRRAEADLSRKAGVRRMDRHHAAHRAAGRLRRRRAAHPRRARARRQLSHQGHQDLHHLWRPRHDRQHRAFRARAPARCARGHQGHLAVPDSEIPGQCRRLARRAQRHLSVRRRAQARHACLADLHHDHGRQGRRHRLPDRRGKPRHALHVHDDEPGPPRRRPRRRRHRRPRLPAGAGLRAGAQPGPRRRQEGRRAGPDHRASRRQADADADARA